ncbi:MAG TPA: ClpX C4-type zinc finger protein [Steroidobacter sp.]|uniref:ClpX C4-type zinc finger protein n=1 Tax=Steroidobacter sp. TaxID=1978227 RepID=UPI002ED7B273
MKRNPPPPVIDAARVVSYAFVDDIPYFGANPGEPLFTENEPREAVPRVAIAVGLAGHIGPRVFHCDEEWIALGACGAETVEQAKREVERNYPGVGERWIDTNVTVEEALAFYDSETAGLKCSFCGRRPFEVEGLIEGPQATICRGCVEEFYEDFQIDDDDVIGN